METVDFAALIQAIRELQAGQIAQTRVLKAIIASHPDRDALREAWRRLSSASIADAALSSAADPSRRAIFEALTAALQDWDSRLAEDPQGL